VVDCGGDGVDVDVDDVGRVSLSLVNGLKLRRLLDV
jgi:hypothetical protein